MAEQGGIAYTFGDNVNTDVIIPAIYLMIPDVKRLATHAMEPSGNVTFLDALKRPGGLQGAYIVAGSDFGSGSSREHAPVVLKENGIEAVIAKSFARIFRENAINIGLRLIECPEAVNNIRQGDKLKIDYGNKVILNLNLPAPCTYPYQQLSNSTAREEEIIAAGSLMPIAIKRAQEIIGKH